MQVPDLYRIKFNLCCGLSSYLFPISLPSFVRLSKRDLLYEARLTIKFKVLGSELQITEIRNTFNNITSVRLKHTHTNTHQTHKHIYTHTLLIQFINRLKLRYQYLSSDRQYMFLSFHPPDSHTWRRAHLELLKVALGDQKKRALSIRRGKHKPPS